MQSIIYGRIVLGKNWKEALELIHKLDDQEFPWIRSKMFSQAETEGSYCYEDVVVAFAASYKGIDPEDMSEWIEKFESLLKQIDFITVKMHLETEFGRLENYCWYSKSYPNTISGGDETTENESWIFTRKELV